MEEFPLATSEFLELSQAKGRVDGDQQVKDLVVLFQFAGVVLPQANEQQRQHEGGQGYYQNLCLLRFLIALLHHRLSASDDLLEFAVDFGKIVGLQECVLEGLAFRQEVEVVDVVGQVVSHLFGFRKVRRQVQGGAVGVEVRIDGLLQVVIHDHQLFKHQLFHLLLLLLKDAIALGLKGSRFLELLDQLEEASVVGSLVVDEVVLPPDGLVQSDANPLEVLEWVALGLIVFPLHFQGIRVNQADHEADADQEEEELLQVLIERRVLHFPEHFQHILNNLVGGVGVALFRFTLAGLEVFLSFFLESFEDAVDFLRVFSGLERSALGDFDDRVHLVEHVEDFLEAGTHHVLLVHDFGLSAENFVILVPFFLQTFQNIFHILTF